MDIIPLINQKGGVGKTTSVINIAAVLAALSYRVLIIDMDVQGNLSHGIKAKTDAHKTIFHVLSGQINIKDAIHSTYLPNIHVIPASMNLAALEIQDLTLLKQKLQPLQSHYDFILIDCPPSLGLPMILSIVASTRIIIPLQCEYFAVKGLVNLLNLLNRIEKQYGTKINIAGILPTMFDPRSKIMRQILEKLQQGLEVPVFNTCIPRSTRVVESNSHGQPVVLFDTNCAASQGYLLFVKAFLKQIHPVKDSVYMCEAR